MTNPGGYLLPMLTPRSAPFRPAMSPVLPPRPTIWDRITQGANRLFGAPPEMPLPEDVRRYALRQGLTAAGSRMLAGPEGGGPETLLQGVGNAIPAAQAAAAGAVGAADQRSQMLANQQAKQVAQSLMADAMGDAHDPNQIGKNMAKLYARMLPLAAVSPEVRAILQQFPALLQALDNAPYLPSADEQRLAIQAYPELRKIPVQLWSKVLPDLAKEGDTQIVVGTDGTVYRVRKHGPEGPVAGVRGTVKGNALNFSNETFRAAAGTLGEANRALNGLQIADVSSAETPLGSAIVQGLVTKIAGEDAGVGVGRLVLARRQAQFQAAADAWVHNYVATLPRSRISPMLIAMIRRTFVPPAGTSDAQTLEFFRKQRDDATNRITMAAQGQQVDLTDLPGYDNPDAPVTSTPAPGTPSPSPKPSKKPAGYDPEFWR